MKLLLTSAGLDNPTILKALSDLAGKPTNELSLAFIPTAMHATEGDKTWFINELEQLHKIGFKQFDIVDIAALPKSQWLPKLKDSDIIYVNGGNTTYLMQQCNKSGLTQELPELLKKRIYIGSSAGSYIATPDLRFNSDNAKEVLPGLHLVDFSLQAHLNNPKFPFAKTPESTINWVKEKHPPYPVYIIDDQMAVKMDGGYIEIVGEGEHIMFDPERNNQA